MPTYTPTSGNISFTQIKQAFANVSKLSDLRNHYYFTASNAYGRLPSGTLSMSALRNGYGDTANVSSGATNIYSGSVSLGVYNRISFSIYGGGGGGFGGTGNYGASGQPGTDGGTTTFGSIASIGGGKASSANANGADGPGAIGYSIGGQNANGTTYRGGTGGHAQIFFDKDTNFDALAALFNTTQTVSNGKGGAGGAGGANFTYIAPNFYPAGNAASGGSGVDGISGMNWS